jgi:hypothetical protein
LTSPTAEALTLALDNATGIAPQLQADARWLWIEAYWPQGRNPDRPTRLPLRREVTGDPDHVPGERLALGVGNDQARAAFDRSAHLVVNAHRLAGVAVAHLNGRTPPTGPNRLARPADYWVVADNTVRRLRWLRERVSPKWSARQRLDAQAAADTFIEAHAALLGVLRDVDGTGMLPPQKRCKNCQNAAAEGRTECWKCINYRMRNKGRVRPVPRHFGAFAARDRRRERGEDFAENPPPRGRYVGGEWTEAS